ncbi:MAG: hypothetical protein GF346_08815 [Candidatus Eisenbacteria bacterium]|nr:hypothetical protein [Candidatus Latescibacterota bacterium]MBD3302535.1 hypothetical protein [Candidatus Eisenbacteria bacterium]
MTNRDPWQTLPAEWSADSRFDGGEDGCGEVLLDLRIHVRSLRPRDRLAVHASDPGAPVEIPAWCRVTGHRLLEARHPFYLVEIKGPDGPVPKEERS